MCGICGFAGRGDRGDLRAMTHAMIHRGPDGVGLYVDDVTGVHLGHRRLAILDLQGGSQPMWNEDGQIGIVFNGEIYNHAELRRVLELQGHRFRTSHSDTEVLIHGYEQWGARLPEHLNGMFAFAIFDRRRRKLFLARDRFGKKPLFYTHRGGFFAFASELSALAMHAGVDRTIDQRSLKKYLAYGFLPAPNAIYRGSRKLPGGCTLTYSLDSEQLEVKSYWRFRVEPADSVPRNADDHLSDELSHLLSQAVRRRLISDVPLGIFLSGGLDSSTILAYATQHTQVDKLKTFSIGFSEPSYDESAHAQRVADWFGSKHYNATVSITQARDLIPSIVERLDEPLGDSSILPTCVLARFARQHITVALGGDGSDELFAGYDPFRALKLAQLYERIVPRPVHAVFRYLVDLLPISTRNMSLDLKLRRALRGVSYPRRFWNPIWLGPLEPTQISELFGEPIDLEDLYSEAVEVWDASVATSLVDRASEFYARLYLQDDILVKLDRASMSASLELRSPFLDNDVVEFCQRLPARYKFRNGVTKYLLKRTASRLLPAEVIRRKKKGFGIPLAQWLRDWDSTKTPRQTPLPNAPWVSARWAEHRAAKADHRQFLWCDLTLQKYGSGQSTSTELETTQPLLPTTAIGQSPAATADALKRAA